VIDGQTGRLVTLDDVDSFAQAMRKLDVSAFDPTRAQANAERFSVAAFQRRLAEHINEVVRDGARAGR
jgi:glycosyltransferase involved in cell wall biosynthesis